MLTYDSTVFSIFTLLALTFTCGRGVALEEDIHNIEHYDVEIYNTIGKLMDELLESEASINIFAL